MTHNAAQPEQAAGSHGRIFFEAAAASEVTSEIA